VNIVPGSKNRVQVTLTPTERATSGSVVPAWTALGLAALFAGVAGVAYIEQSKSVAEFNAATSGCNLDRPMKGDSGCQGKYDSIENDRLWILGGIVGAGAAAATSFILFWQASADRPTSAHHIFACAPRLGASGVTCAATF
jgi:hypothetical protein